ncbi:MAG: hypothetical protein KDB01_27730 [Planctomycetaceae bacterium]|nr:hypothetical protein [Planctomycetaceae bacterium]
MDNESKWYDRWRPGIVLSTIPIVFFGVLVGLGLWQDCSDSYEVSAFIENHRKSIQSQRSNPSVHRFELSHDPAYQGRLLIQIDVDDKQTDWRLADTMGDCYQLKELPQWKTLIRHGEDLEMDSGQVAMGAGAAINGISEVVFRYFAAMISSFFAFVVSLLISRRMGPLSQLSHDN